MSDWEQVERHFDRANAGVLRGENRGDDDLRYASYILKACEPMQGAEVLDLGCGDGVICRAIKKPRPDLSI